MPRRLDEAKRREEPPLHRTTAEIGGASASFAIRNFQPPGLRASRDLPAYLFRDASTMAVGRTGHAAAEITPGAPMLEPFQPEARRRHQPKPGAVFQSEIDAHIQFCPPTATHFAQSASSPTGALSGALHLRLRQSARRHLLRGDATDILD